MSMFAEYKLGRKGAMVTIFIQFNIMLVSFRNIHLLRKREYTFFADLMQQMILLWTAENFNISSFDIWNEQ